MAQQLIDIGTTANDGTGDQLRDAFDKTNDNTTELYDADVVINAGNGTPVRPTAPLNALIGAAGDTIGMIAVDATSVYVCFETYVAGASDIWLQVTPADIVANADDIVINAGLIGTNSTDISTNLASINNINLGLGTVANATIPALPHGVAGDLAGQIAYEDGFLYVCILDYLNDTTISWQRVAIASSDPTTW